MHTITILMDECGQEEKDLHNEFARLHPQVNINFEYVNEVRKNMILTDQYNSGKLPDIIQLGSSNIPYLTDKGLLLDLTPWLERENELQNCKFDKVSLELFKWNGIQTGIPASTTTKGIFYNKSWFDKANLPYPKDDWTWEDFLQSAIHIHHSNVIEEDMYGANLSFHYEYLEPLLVNNGARLFSPDGTKASGYINSEEAIEAIQGAVDLVRVHKVSRPTLSYFDTRPFSRRKTGMTLEFYLTLFELEPLLQDELGVVGLPSFGSKPKVACPFVNGFGISSTCGNPETAWELIWSLCSNDNAYTRMVSLGGTPSLIALLEDKKYYAEPNRKAILRELQYARKEHFPNDPSGNPLPFLQPLINPAIEKILVHGDVTRETLNRLAIELDLALEERWKKLR